MDKDIEKMLGYSFPVTPQSLRLLEPSILMGTHDFLLSRLIESNYKNESLKNQYQWCRKEIIDRLNSLKWGG